MTSIFISPDSGEKLQWNNEKECLETTTGHYQYSCVDGVYRLLPQRDEVKKATPFDYADHYQKDAEHFDYSAGWEDPAAVHENQRLHQMILAQGATRAQRVLDVGCGAAWVASHFKGKDVEVYSMDISTVNPEKAVATYPFNKHYGVVADVFYLPFEKESFDFIVASEIIEHVDNPAMFLDGLLKVLAPGGTLVVTTPHDEKLAYSLCVHCNKPTPHHAHLHSFTADSLRELLPSLVQRSTKTATFMNKVLLHARTHVILRHLPFGIWRLVDRLVNVFIPKTARLMLTVRRPA